MCLPLAPSPMVSCCSVPNYISTVDNNRSKADTSASGVVLIRVLSTSKPLYELDLTNSTIDRIKQECPSTSSETKESTSLESTVNCESCSNSSCSYCASSDKTGMCTNVGHSTSNCRNNVSRSNTQEIGKSFESISSSSSSINLITSWKSTGTDSFLRNAPLLVRSLDDFNVKDGSPDAVDEPISDAAKKLGQILSQSSRRLPGKNQYASNHVMVNQERLRQCAAPLIRLSELDSIAREHAEKMALEDRLFHSDPKALCDRFHRPFRRMGENVAKGPSIHVIHRSMMDDSKSDRNNIIDRRYTHFGMGTARCRKDGELYLCQVFRG